MKFIDPTTKSQKLENKLKHVTCLEERKYANFKRMTLGKTSRGKLELPEKVVNGLDWIRSTHLTLSHNNTSWYRKQALKGKKNSLESKVWSRLVTLATAFGQTPGLVTPTLLTPSLDTSELKFQKFLAIECEKQLGGSLKNSSGRLTEGIFVKEFSSILYASQLR